MSMHGLICTAMVALLAAGPAGSFSEAKPDAQLPPGMKVVWDVGKAYREKTPTRERICINGLWRWQPAKEATDRVPTDRWGYFKVPGCWPGITNYMQKDSQTVHAHPAWENEDLRGISMAWYQREITVPRQWSGRRIAVSAEYLNSHATLYLNGKKVGEIQFPRGEVDITSACRPGRKYVLSLLVIAMPLKGVMLSYNDTASARKVKGSVARRGLCGDVFLVSTPSGARIDDVKVDTSVRRSEIAFSTALADLRPGKAYSLSARITDKGREVETLDSRRFKARDLEQGRFSFSAKWKPPDLWDIHTPQNMYDLRISLRDAGGKELDVYRPVRFGFREFRIDGRDFLLNGTRLFCSAVPFDNAQVGAALASYEGARESMLRLKSLGVNSVYTHNYGCTPGSHLSFEEILRAADDVGLLVFLSQPHFSAYEWDAPDADRKNGYARHAEFYVRVAGNHPSVVMYATSHNATGYAEDMNPDMIDGIHDARGPWSAKNVNRAVRAEAIIRRLDPSRPVYHHSSGNLGTMHTSNFYLNFVPIQERSDWFEHWATKGVKPVFLCEYGAPFSWSWTMYRGWYKGKRAFGSAKVPWEFCLAEWNSQFLGDRAYRVSDMEKANLRWEAKQFRAGKLWHRWDYPYRVGSNPRRFLDRHEVWAMYITDNWRAFRTWGLSAFCPWDHGVFWKLRDGVNKDREELKTDWDKLQRPGLVPDYIEERYERVDLAFERSDWIPTVAGRALLRNNQPLLAYIGGKPSHFTRKDHDFLPGETVEKQVIIINNSRVTVSCDCSWSLALPRAVGDTEKVEVATGRMRRIPLRFALPEKLDPGEYELKIKVEFSSGETQEDSLAIHVLPTPGPAQAAGRIALYDPKGETAKLLRDLGVRCSPVKANANLASYGLLIVGRGALTVDGAAPEIDRVRDGLKIVMFEQTPDVLEKRLGFRIQEYGLRRVFKRVPDHPILEGLGAENLRDWRGEATIVPPRLKYELRPGRGVTVTRSGIEVTRPWRSGCRGTVASVLIEKPARGDFLPIVDGGFSLQYSPLMEYREGKGMMVICQLDVTGRTESDPAAERLVRNLVEYASNWKPEPRREVLYVGEAAGREHLLAAGLKAGSYAGGNLDADQVLVVGPGGGESLSSRRGPIARWLRKGGDLLAVGLSQSEANAFLPFRVKTRRAEHISAYFEPPGMQSPLAGIGPADVHNRDPRRIDLVSGGATPLGNGVLAVSKDANVVFCQLAPWQFEYGNLTNVKRTFRRASCLLARLLGNMGCGGSTPLLLRFSSPVSAAEAESAEGRWLQGFYLDEPEELDDPYRFFRW